MAVITGLGEGWTKEGEEGWGTAALHVPAQVKVLL